ncbi:hypothetical protein HID58_065830 [Brassica napus]|uniref:Uncharacterized protein n=1 Tax=Brassica napus TaxID=3708 RepID=A0ABQ7ZEE2_BRANA|nr:hypothetical protein HID58_065830 [Brassica napus]
MIFYFVLLHYSRRRWFRLGSTCPSCRIIPVAHITPVSALQLFSQSELNYP